MSGLDYLSHDLDHTIKIMRNEVGLCKRKKEQNLQDLDEKRRKLLNTPIYGGLLNNLADPGRLKTKQTVANAGPEIIKNKVFLDGDKKLAVTRKLLRSRYLSRQQELFTGIFVQCVLQKLYKDEYQQNEVRIKKQNKIDIMCRQALVALPRRFGKTVASALFIACIMIAIPGFKVAVFSPTHDQSRMFIDEVRKALVKFKADGYKYNFKPDNKNKIGIEYNGTQSICIGFTSNEDVSLKNILFILFSQPYRNY